MSTATGTTGRSGRPAVSLAVNTALPRGTENATTLPLNITARTVSDHSPRLKTVAPRHALWTEAGRTGRRGPRAVRRVDTEEVQPGRESATNLRHLTVENHALDQLLKSSSASRQIATTGRHGQNGRAVLSCVASNHSIKGTGNVYWKTAWFTERTSSNTARENQ